MRRGPRSESATYRKREGSLTEAGHHEHEAKLQTHLWNVAVDSSLHQRLAVDGKLVDRFGDQAQDI